LDCPSFSVKKIEDPESQRSSVLRISGCSRSALEGELFVYKGELTKKFQTESSPLKLDEKEVAKIKDKIQKSGLLVDVKISNEEGMTFINETEEQDLRSNMSRYKLTWSTSFSVLGKKMNWYLFTAQAKFKLMVQKPIAEGGEYDRPRDLEKIYEEPLPLVVYEYDDVVHYFGNGLHGGCEVFYRAYARTSKINSQMPSSLPSHIYELPGVLDHLIIRLSSGPIYLWNVKTKEFKVISGG